MTYFKKYLILFLKGVGMGSADVVPGVSGGTIAFITGIYEQLLDSINSIDKKAFQLIIGLKFKEFWDHINGSFLLPLLSGILVSVLTFARIISHFLETNPIQVWSFFFGLIIISSISVAREIKVWSIGIVVSCIFGISAAYLTTSITPTNTTNELWFVFISGAVSICAMILPGISGSFILLILGKYAYIMKSVNDMNVIVVAVFISGCVVGLLSFSRAVSWLLKKFHDFAVAILAGFMIGSLNKIWPWKKAIRFDWIGDKQIPTLERNILPSQYLEETGKHPMIIQAVLFMFLGFILVIAIEKISMAMSRQTTK